MNQRRPRLLDPVYLAFLRLQPCYVCGSRERVQAAHIRMACPERDKRYCGKGEKPDDRWAVPLCALDHVDGKLSQHKIGERKFWALHQLDPFEIAARLYKIGHGTEAPAKRRAWNPDNPRPKKKRGRTSEIRPKVWQGKRKWPSQPFPKGRKLRSGRVRDAGILRTHR